MEKYMVFIHKECEPSGGILDLEARVNSEEEARIFADEFTKELKQHVSHKVQIYDTHTGETIHYVI